jgi:hypothetical protein
MAQDSLISKLRGIYDGAVRFIVEGANRDTPEGYGVAVHGPQGPYTFYTGLGVSRVGPIAIDEASLVIDETSSMYHVYMNTRRRNAVRDVRIHGNNNTVDLANVISLARSTIATITGDNNNFLGSRYTDDVTIRDSQNNSGNLRGGDDRLTVEIGEDTNALSSRFTNYRGGNGNDTLILSGDLEGEIQFRRSGDGIAFYRSVRNSEGQPALVRIGTFSEFENIQFLYNGQTISRSMADIEAHIDDEAAERALANDEQRYEVLNISESSVDFGRPVRTIIPLAHSTGTERDA